MIKKNVKSETSPGYQEKPAVNVHHVRALVNKRILITAGPTWVAIDDVRVISNSSTGELGRILAKKLKSAGALVTLLEGPVSDPLKNRTVKVIKYTFFSELDELLNAELKKNYDCVIHSAAVSDYRPQKKFTQKISSNQKILKLNLVKTPKLINRIKKLSPKTILIGFKLESDFNKHSVVEETRRLFSQAHCDFVVANFFGPKGYEAFILDKKRTLLGKVKSRSELSSALVDILKTQI